MNAVLDKMILLAVVTATSCALDEHGGQGAGDEAALVTTPRFYASAIAGSGFQNTIARSPFPDSSGHFPLLVGADVAGLHRSINGGATWHARMGIYYTTSGGTFRLDDAASAGTGSSGVKISSIGSSPMAVSGTGHVYIAEASFDAPGARMWRSTNPTAAVPTFTDISDTYFRGAGCNTKWLAAGPDDYLFTSSSGGGVNVGEP
jgi:hypothetical protein